MKKKENNNNINNKILSNKNINNIILTPTPKGNAEENIKEDINFNYLLFPELDFELYCNDGNVNDYYPPPDYSEEIEAVNTICISKSSLGENLNRNLEMRENEN